jgi:hypothetical protein
MNLRDEPASIIGQATQQYRTVTYAYAMLNYPLPPDVPIWRRLACRLFYAEERYSVFID